MPKKNKKRGGAKAQDSNVLLPSSRTRDDDGSMDDNCSTQSVLSDDSSWQSLDPANCDDDTEAISEQQNFENNFNDFVDATLEKSSTTRINALKGIKKSLQQKYVPTFLDGRKETVVDSLSKCMRKGKGEEVSLAATCLCLMTVQLGDDAESVFRSTQPLLTTLLNDASTSYTARASCALSLAVSSVICCDDDPEIVNILNNALEVIIRSGYGKGENSPGVRPEDCWLICQALNTWCFMLAFAPSYQVQKHIDEHMSYIPDLLQSSDVDLRIAAGQALALMYELARDYNEDFEFEEEEALCEMLKQLSTDFMKYHGKKDRREQKSHFRDIYSSVQNYDSPTETIRLGKMNQFELNGWAQKRQYECLCQVLGNGISAHLKANPLLRELFDLGAPGMDEYSYKRSLSKAQRTSINAATFKARCKARAKHRDKRSASTYGY